MTTMFWILWFFIAFVIVLVALTLRKENDDLPRREILRAVESTGKMGFAERLFLWIFSWLDTRFRLTRLLEHVQRRILQHAPTDAIDAR